MKIARVFDSLLLILLFISPVFSAETPKNETEAIIYPGIGEVVPRATALSEEATGTETKLQQLVITKNYANRLQEILDRHTELKQRVSSYGPIESWYFDRQLEVSSALKALDKNLRQLQQEIATQLNAVDALRSAWQGRKTFWQEWEIQLKEEKTKRPSDTFSQVMKITGQVITAADKGSPPLVDLQKKISSLQQEVLEQIGQTEAALAKLRHELFKRNGHSLFKPAFWQQFTPELWQMTQRELRGSLQIQTDFYRNNLMLISAQILFALITTSLIYRYRSAIDNSSHWHILTQHPIATGLFAAIVFLSFFYTGISPLFRLLLATFGLCSAVQLIRGLIKTRPVLFCLYSFTFLTLLTLTIRLTGLPLPYYRCYLLLLNLILLPLLLFLFRYCRKRLELVKAIFWFRLLGLLLLIALGANLSGYVTLGLRAIESSIESVIVILFAILTYKIGLGALTFLFSRASIRKNLIIYNFSRNFQRRCERWLSLTLSCYIALYLSTIWGFYSSSAQAWDALLSVSLTVASYQISLDMVLLVILVFYLSLELSWLLQVILDQHLFERRNYDRGVRDSVKKLLHYTLVLIGFLLAAGAAGFKLQNFLVLAGALGIGIGFGLQDIANNFISGIILLFERPIKVGDGILIDNDYGTVKRIGLRSTVVETLDQAELIVPNAQIVSQKVTNWTLSTRRVRMVLPVGVAYGSPLERVQSILLEAGEQHPDVLETPKPSPIFVQFGDSSLDFELRVWISDVDKRPKVKSELLLFIDQRFREENVEIPFPQRDLHLRSVSPGVLPEAGPSETPT